MQRKPIQLEKIKIKDTSEQDQKLRQDLMTALEELNIGMGNLSSHVVMAHLTTKEEQQEILRDIENRKRNDEDRKLAEKLANDAEQEEQDRLFAQTLNDDHVTSTTTTTSTSQSRASSSAANNPSGFFVDIAKINRNMDAHLNEEIKKTSSQFSENYIFTDRKDKALEGLKQFKKTQGWIGWAANHGVERVNVYRSVIEKTGNLFELNMVLLAIFTAVTNAEKKVEGQNVRAAMRKTLGKGYESDEAACGTLLQQMRGVIDPNKRSKILTDVVFKINDAVLCMKEQQYRMADIQIASIKGILSEAELNVAPQEQPSELKFN